MNIATLTLKLTDGWVNLEDKLTNRFESPFNFEQNVEYYIQVQAGFLLLQESTTTPNKGSREGVLQRSDKFPCVYTKGLGNLYVTCIGNTTVTFNISDNK